MRTAAVVEAEAEGVADVRVDVIHEHAVGRRHLRAFARSKRGRTYAVRKAPSLLEPAEVTGAHQQLEPRFFFCSCFESSSGQLIFF